MLRGMGAGPEKRNFNNAPAAPTSSKYQRHQTAQKIHLYHLRIFDFRGYLVIDYLNYQLNGVKVRRDYESISI